MYAKNFHGENWIPVTVIKLTGPLSYQVQTDAGIVLHCHVDHLQFRYPDDNNHSLDNDGLDSDLVINDVDNWSWPVEPGILEEPDVEEDRQDFHLLFHPLSYSLKGDHNLIGLPLYTFL